jgi:HNH endonuclease
MHQTLFKAMNEGCMEDEIIIGRLKEQSTLRSSLKEINDEDREHGRNFSIETKNSLVIKKIVEAAARCGICGARLHFGSVSFDHKIRREDGGTGTPENAQLSHFYCNTGHKESLHSGRLST